MREQTGVRGKLVTELQILVQVILQTKADARVRDVHGLVADVRVQPWVVQHGMETRQRATHSRDVLIMPATEDAMERMLYVPLTLPKRNARQI